MVCQKPNKCVNSYSDHLGKNFFDYTYFSLSVWELGGGGVKTHLTHRHDNQYFKFYDINYIYFDGKCSNQLTKAVVTYVTP